MDFQFHAMVALLFWLSCGLLFFTFAGYGLFIAALARRRSAKAQPARSGDAGFPSVSVVLIAYNEEKRIAERLRNLLAAQYPADQLRVRLVSDGSTDATVAEARALGDPRVTILEQPARAGKAAGLNLALEQCTADIVVFADASQRFAEDAIARLVAHFSDPAVGGVSGALEIAPAATATGTGIDAYWTYEKSLRASESRFDSCIGCTGAIYALRRSLFTPIPVDTLLDDVVIPMQAAVQGARILFDPEARAFDPRPLEPEAEQRRKRRTLAGGFQMGFRYPAWLLPWKNRLWWQLLAHKYLRLLAPLFLVGALGCSFLLRGHLFYAAAFLGQIALYAAALLGLAGWRTRLSNLAAGFVFLNAMTIMGLVYYSTCKAERGWGK